MPEDQKLEQLKQKYQSVLNEIQAQGVRLSHVNMQDGKLFIQGEAPSEQAKDKVWDQIKLVDPSYSDLTADISAAAGASQPPPQAAAANGSGTGSDKTYTVQPGDSLSKISQQFYGNANEYTKIYNANRDTLSDPNRVSAGQTLKIPS